MGIQELYKCAKHHMLGAEWGKAADLFEKICKEDNEIGAIHYNLASCYFELGVYQKAFEHYSVAATIEPDDVTCFNIGVVAEKLGDVEVARQSYEKAIAFRHDYFDAHYNLALLAIGARDLGQDIAIKHLKICETLQPDNKTVQFQLARIGLNLKVDKPPLEHVESLFDSYADHFDTHLMDTLGYSLPTKIVALLSGIDLSESHVLDLGCGTGLVGEALNQNIKRLDGVDISSKMLEQAKLKNCYHQLIKVDIEKYLNSTSTQYGMIIAADVLNYFGNLERVFKGVSSALSDQGIFCFSVETARDDKTTFELQASGRYLHGADYIQSLMKKFGFKVTSKQDVVGREQGGEKVHQCIYMLTYQNMICD